MPTYDYGCVNCGHVIEVVHGVHDPGPTVCPECGGLLRKRLSPPAIHFRGSGWAKKDARDAQKRTPAAAGTKAQGDHDSMATKDAKAAKTDAKAGDGASSASTASSDGE